MSFSRRLAVGIPAAGATVLAALALSGAPAMATNDAAGAYPAAMTSPDPAGTRGADAYGGEAPATTTTATATATSDSGDTRGNAGYGGEAPTTEPTPSASVPTGSTASVPPGGGVKDETASPVPSQSTGGAGVSSGGTLPLTGAPVGGTLALGGLLLAGGAAAVVYGRRRRA